MTRYLDNYRIETARIKNWNYGGPGKYFITVCTKFHEHYFGEILNGEMLLNSIGEEVINQWLLTPTLRPDVNITLDSFQVMPNHFHGIIEIGWNRFNVRPFCRDGRPAVSTKGTSVPGKDAYGANKFGPQINNLGSIMRGFKSSVTTFARQQVVPELGLDI